MLSSFVLMAMRIDLFATLLISFDVALDALYCQSSLSCICLHCDLSVVLFLSMQGLTIIAFNNGSFDMKTVLQLLSLGPTYVAMKFIES